VSCRHNRAPPYGYRLADAGPHPNPAKAADGKRLHKLEPHPATAWVIRRIFAEYLAGRGLFAIAEGLTRDGIPSPSQHDRARNPHRTGEGWSQVRCPRHGSCARGEWPGTYMPMITGELVLGGPR
jgi:Recombinase